MSSKPSSGVIGGIISVIMFGIGGTSLISIFLGIEGDFNVDKLYNNLNLDSAAKVQTYFVILLSWALGGLIAGVRTKNANKGFLSGLFGAFIGSLSILLIYLSAAVADIFAIDVSSILSTIPGFFIGMAGLMLVSGLIGFGAGKATQETKKASPRPKSKKAWSDKSKWNCSKCGNPIPPGKMNCPKCGAGVIQ